MQRVYIVFSNRSDEAAGLVQLARNTRVDALPGGVYAVDAKDLKWLENSSLSYRYATDTEIEIAAERIRHPATPAVQ